MARLLSTIRDHLFAVTKEHQLLELAERSPSAVLNEGGKRYSDALRTLRGSDKR
jgi:hypothetical protein